MMIAIEGIDASGKATQSVWLSQKLKAALFSFPNYTTPTGVMIRKMLVNQMWVSPTMYDATVLQALMTINRYEQAGVIAAKRSLGQHVVCDRYVASSHVYGTFDGVSSDWIALISDCLPQPDHYVLIDIPVALATERRPEARDKYERDKKGMEAKRSAYLHLFNRMRKLQYKGDSPSLLPWHIVDGQGTVAEVHARICAAIGV